jgi:hypothetical protein
MHEQAKVEEARYFLAQMAITANQRKAFNHNLSAFLAAARSVLQYANKEATKKPGGQAWYDTQVGAKPIIKFLKDKRDINIHARPITPLASVEVSVSDTLHLSESVSCTIEYADGRREDRTAVSSSEVKPEGTTTTVSYMYFFDDWNGSEDLLTLCSTYITDVEAIVADGIANGWLTP